MFVQIKRRGVLQQTLVTIVDFVGRAWRKDVGGRPAENFRARQPPLIFARAIDQYEPPVAGLLHKNRDRHIFHDQIEEIPVAVALALRGDPVRDVLVRRHPSAIGHRPGHGMDRPPIRAALHRACGLAFGDRRVQSCAVLLHVLGKSAHLFMMTKKVLYRAPGFHDMGR